MGLVRDGGVGFHIMILYGIAKECGVFFFIGGACGIFLGDLSATQCTCKYVRTRNCTATVIQHNRFHSQRMKCR